MSNIITIAGENDNNSKKKKGGGVNSVLTLMKDLADFQDKVQVCIDAQDITEMSDKLEVFYDKLDEMAEVLLGMASEGIKSKRKMGDAEESEEVISDSPEKSSEKSMTSQESIVKMLNDKPKSLSPGRVHIVNTPTVPRLPR